MFRQLPQLRQAWLLLLFGATVVLYWLTLHDKAAVRHQSILRLPPLAPAPVSGSTDLANADAAFVSWPLARACNEASWQPGLVFVCDNNSGGIGNIRGYILTCLRYAIAAGAPGLVLPRIRTRSLHNLSDIMHDYSNFSYFFDEGHFRAGLRDGCPQITLFPNKEAIPYATPEQITIPVPKLAAEANNASLAANASLPSPGPGSSADSSTTTKFFPEMITPKSFENKSLCDSRDLNRHTDLFGARFRLWLQTTALTHRLPAMSPEHPRVIHFRWGVQLEWPTWRDGPEFANTFGGLLRIRPDILALGKRMAAAMRHWATTHVGSQPGPPGYVGVHLRTEHDALDDWPTFDQQARAYLDAISQKPFKAVFLATGNWTEAAKFTEVAKTRYGLAVASKHDLLAGADRTKLASLTWDQQSLADFLVLLESNYFLGVNPSSFSMTIALKRHLRTEGLYTRPWQVGGTGDGWSWIMGRYDNYWQDWLYMYESIWP